MLEKTAVPSVFYPPKSGIEIGRKSPSHIRAKVPLPFQSPSPPCLNSIRPLFIPPFLPTPLPYALSTFPSTFPLPLLVA